MHVCGLKVLLGKGWGGEMNERIFCVDLSTNDDIEEDCNNKLFEDETALFNSSVQSD